MRPVVVMSCGVSEDRTAFSGSLRYVRAVEEAGAAVIVVPPKAPPADQYESSLSAVCALADAVLLPGGYDVDPDRFGEEALPGNGRVDPEVDELDFFLARYALQHDLPVLGICRGCQVLNVATGGTLCQDLASAWGRKGLLQHRQLAPRWHGTHRVTISPDSLLAGILGENNLRVNSFHHQAASTVGPGMRIVARAADGVIEAIEAPDRRFALGVQWHPECMVEQHEEQRRLFAAFVQAAVKE